MYLEALFVFPYLLACLGTSTPYLSTLHIDISAATTVTTQIATLAVSLVLVLDARNSVFLRVFLQRVVFFVYDWRTITLTISVLDDFVKLGCLTTTLFKTIVLKDVLLIFLFYFFK